MNRTAANFRHDRPLAFLHLFKTAGTTLESVVRRQYHNIGIIKFGSLKETNTFLSQFRRWPDEQKSRIKVFMGHFHFRQHTLLPENCDYITILRDPVGRMMSEYYFILENPDIVHYNRIKSENISLVEFARQGMYGAMDNLQTKYLSSGKTEGYGVYSTEILETAKQNLQKYFPVVGVVEQFDEMMVFLKRTFDWRTPYYVRENITKKRPRKDSLSTVELQALKDVSKMDCELYDHVKNQFNAAIMQLGDDFENEVKAFKILNQFSGPYMKYFSRPDTFSEAETHLMKLTVESLRGSEQQGERDIVIDYARKTYPHCDEFRNVKIVVPERPAAPVPQQFVESKIASPGSNQSIASEDSSVESEKKTDLPLIFLHVMKAAGTSLREVMGRQYGEDNVHNYKEAPFYHRAPNDSVNVSKDTKAIAGHIQYHFRNRFPAPATWITVLRNPVDRVISHFNFIINTPTMHFHKYAIQRSINKFIQDGLFLWADNAQVKLLSGDLDVRPGKCTPQHLENAQKNLRENFRVVGLSERFDETVILMKRTFGWRTPYYVKGNVSRMGKSRQEYSKDILAEIERYQQYDNELYRYAADLFDEQISRQDASFAEEVRVFKLVNQYCERYISSLGNTDEFPETEVVLTIDTVYGLLREQRYDEADLVLKHTIRKYPNSEDLYNLQALVRYEKGSIKEAENMFADLIKRSPQHPGAYCYYGAMLWERGEQEAAMKYFSTALSNNPTHRETVLRCGKALSSLNRPDEAQMLYTMYLQKHPSDGEIQWLRRDLKSGEGETTGSIQIGSGDIDKHLDTRTSSSYRVTAIVSTYKSEYLFDGCLQDLFEQTIYESGELEIIIVDSASPEKEWDVIARYAKDHKHILAIRTEKRESLYAAWNRAIRLARGEYLTSANTDDRHRKDALEVLAKALDDNSNVAIVYGDCLTTNQPNETFARNSAEDALRWGEYSPEKLENHCCVGPQPVWRKSLHEEIGYFDERYRSAADYDFWLRVSEKYPLMHIDEILGLYYKNPQSLGNGGMNVHYERIEVQKRHLERKRKAKGEDQVINTNQLDLMTVAEEIYDLLEKYELKDLFLDMDWRDDTDGKTTGVACLRVAQRLIQLNDLRGASEYLNRSYELMPLKQTRDMIAKMGVSANTSTFEKRVPSEQLHRYPQPHNMLFIANGFPPKNVAGTELHTFWLAKELNYRGYNVSVICPELDETRPAYQIKEETFEGINVARMSLHVPLNGVEGFIDEQAAAAVSKYAQKVNAELAHFQHLIGISATSIDACRKRNIPTIMTVHDGWLLCAENHFVLPDGQFCSGPESAQKCADCMIERMPELQLTERRVQITNLMDLRKQYLQRSLKWMDAMIVPSAYTKNRMEEFGFDHPAMKLLPHGIPHFQPLPRQESDEKLRFTYLGHIFFTKGLDLLIKAFNQTDPAEAMLNVYGIKSDPEYFDATMKQIDANHEVNYEGVYTPDDLPKILSETDVVVIPSRSESFSYVVREAFHAKVPVIGPDVGGVPEAVIDGKNGLLFEPDKWEDLSRKLCHIIDQPDDLERYREHIEPVLTIEKYVDRIEEIYAEVCEKSTRQSTVLSAVRTTDQKATPMSTVT